MKRKASRNNRPAGASRHVGHANRPEKSGVWQETKNLAAEAWLEFFRHSLIIVPLIPLGLLMWLVEKWHVSGEVQRLLEFGEFLIILIQLWKLVRHLVSDTKNKGSNEAIKRETPSCNPNSSSSNVVGKVK
ncbi:hypothetical protein [Cupriavidus sp. UYPR2.512]|uniref:hypothetical protein n=1 Tax=Cupriavidus sp. UYPR2.512 TaxID=1080187 RepID=UPI00047760C6|nr:hypothetical protein [Cupriavidus sp. UYPR2.512]UIF89408.1 hypothetical protein KAF44_29495 [Cupriavidus necator]